MKRGFWLGMALVAALLFCGIALWRSQPERVSPVEIAAPEPAPATAGAEKVGPDAETPKQAVAVTGAARLPAIKVVAGTPDDPASQLRIRAGEILATVNGVRLELKDLLPLRQGEENAERTMSAERYAFLLDRAVDRELTVQAARAQGVDLTEFQREQLAKLRSRSERPQANVFDTLEHNPANAEFEARDASALLLQTSLAEKAGVPARDVNAAQVEAYFQKHQAEFVAMPTDTAQRAAAWEKTDAEIRVKLAVETETQHEEQFQKFVSGLRASAQITKVKP